MRNKFSLPATTFVFFIVSALSAQVNEYLMHTPLWQVRLNVYSGSDCTGYQDLYNYKIFGVDTVIGSQTYKKIYKEGVYSPVDFFCNPYSPAPYHNTSPSFCLRSAGKEMYVVEAGETTEELLYDFDLNVGDTLPPSYVVSASQFITVTAVDSFSTAFGYRKRFALSSASAYLYEGIGSSAGLTEPIDQVFLSGTRTLLCFSLDDIRYVPTAGGAGTCQIFSGIKEIMPGNSSTVYPNPFSEFANVQLASPVKNASLLLFNSDGAKLRSFSFSGDRFLLRKENLRAGIYYYQIVQDDGKISGGKLMIVD